MVSAVVPFLYSYCCLEIQEEWDTIKSAIECRSDAMDRGGGGISNNTIDDNLMLIYIYTTVLCTTIEKVKSKEITKNFELNWKTLS